jgi:hypothetical protein
VNLNICPSCGAPLPVAKPGAVESCRFCGAEGRASEAAVSRGPVPSPSEPFVVDEVAIEELCSSYIHNVRAYTQKTRVRDGATGIDAEPNEKLMRAIEDEIDIPDRRRDDFRRELMTLVGALAVDGKTFDSRTNERMRKALELRMLGLK